MSLIILIERDAPRAARVGSALEAEGWLVEVCETLDAASSVTADRPVELVVVGPGADQAAAVGYFSSPGKGVGVLTMGGPVPGADGVIDPSATDDEIRRAARRCMSELSRAAVERAAAKDSSKRGQFTSKDIFGDMLAEVEEEVTAAGEPRRPASQVTPPIDPAPSRPTKTSSQSEVDRKLEQTLSGVLDTPKTKRKPKPAARKGADLGELDDLISKTLSGVAKGGAKSRPRKPEPPPLVKEPELEILPEPEVTPPTPRRRPPRPSAELEVDALANSIGLRPKRTAEPTAPAKGGDVYSTMRMPVVEMPEASGDAPGPVGPPPSQAEPREVEAIQSSAPAEPVIEAPAKVEKAAGEDEPNRFGQYTLLDQIAVGGMAEVWKARMQGVEGFQKNVAIKRILPHLTDSSDFLTMFIDEAKLAAQLNHPNIIHIYDLGKIDSDYYIAMEYIHGKDLRSILNEARKVGKPLPTGLAVLIASRLASGLDHAHRKRDFDDRDLGLVHRDVSPQNVLVSFDGDIKLCDFGIAKAVAKASQTQMGALKGKLQYMSPEQAWGRVVDARSDIFSLGAVLFEMLTGERLFTGDSEISVLESVREGKVRSVREIAGQVPPELDAVVARALAKDPDDRYQTAGEMQQELEAILFSLKPTPVEATLGEFMRSVYGDAASSPGDSQEIPVTRTASGTAPSMTGSSVVAAVPPKGKEPADDSGGPSLGLWLGIAAVLLVIAGVLWFVLGGDRGASSEGASTTESAVPAETAVPAISPSDAVVEDPAEDAAGTGEGTEPGSSPGAGVDAADDLTALVDQQVQKREAELSRQQDEAKRELERQLEEARRAAEAAEEEAAAQAAALTPAPADPATSPDEASTVDDAESATAVAVTDPGTDTPVGESDAAAGEGETALGDEVSESDETTSPVNEATSTPATIREQAPPPPPEPEPEPAGPRYSTGEMVTPGTPGLVAPRLLDIQTPEYPPVARRMKVQGTVVIDVLVDETGRAQETRVVSGVKQNVGLNEAAERAARGARFQPATIEGVRVKTWFKLSIPFRL